MHKIVAEAVAAPVNGRGDILMKQWACLEESGTNCEVPRVGNASRRTSKRFPVTQRHKNANRRF